MSRVRTCANKVVAGVRFSARLPEIRQVSTRQLASAQQIDQLEGLAVAIPWGFESPFRTIRLAFQLACGRALHHVECPERAARQLQAGEARVEGP